LTVNNAPFTQNGGGGENPQPGTSSEKAGFCFMPRSIMINAGALQWHLKDLSVWASNMSE